MHTKSFVAKELVQSTEHVLRLADDEPYRREIKGQANLTEGRHDLARRIFHGAPWTRKPSWQHSCGLQPPTGTAPVAHWSLRSHQ
ncbi:Tn3 family transposase [Nocardia sp. NPDC004278]